MPLYWDILIEISSNKYPQKVSSYRHANTAERSWASYYARREEIDAAVLQTLASKWYILGKEVEAFEKEFAAYLGCSGGAGIAERNGGDPTCAAGCGVERGEAVFTVSRTAAATAAAIVLVGAVPVFVDTDPETWTMDPASLEAAIRGCELRMRAAIPVHLYGHPADMTAILEIAQRHGLAVIEDCAQSHGTPVEGTIYRHVGRHRGIQLLSDKEPWRFRRWRWRLFETTRTGAEGRLLREYGWI